MMMMMMMMMIIIIIIIIIIIKIPKNSHVGHCTHSTEGSNVKVQNTFHGRNNVTCNTNCILKRAATLYILDS